MKKIIFVCMLVLVSLISVSCDKKANNDDLQLYNTENTFSTGGEDDDPVEPDGN